MTAHKPARIFISYATKDGATAAAKLRLELERQGLSIWQDIIALQGDADRWSQIENALRSKELQHFILIVTPGALASPIVRRQIRLSRQEGKTVSPVRGPGIDSKSKLPRWLGNLYDLDIRKRRTNLLRVLELPSAAKRVPMMAPELPADFVQRPGEFGALKQQLLDTNGGAVAITAALCGAGGDGKTTLAKALAHDPDIQAAYFDGVLWVELGEQGDARLLALISDLVALLTGEARAMTTIEAARTALAEALGEHRVLLVIDDVWQKHHLDPFLQGGKHATRLVTTRFGRELPDTAVVQAVDAMQASEALKLLSWGLPDKQAKPLVGKLGDLAQKLHDGAQLLKLANGFLRDRVTKFKQPLAQAIEEVGQRLAAKGLPAFDDTKAKGEEGRHTSLTAAIGINLDLLDADKRARFGALGIFPEDTDIPIGIVARLWAPAGESPNDVATLDLLTELYDLSLLLDLDLDRRTIRFHGTTRHFLQHQAGKAGLAAQHKRLIQAMGDMGGVKEAPRSDTEYFYRTLPDHLAGAEDRETLDQLLLDPGWLQAKLDTIKSPQALVADYEQHGQGQMQNLIGRTLRLTAGICVRDQRQMLPQLAGRLMACADPAAPAFLASARRQIRPPALTTQRQSLTPPGAETARLEGHVSSVTALAVLPDTDGKGCWLASGSRDNTIRLWDPKSGAEATRLEGHTSWVRVLTVLPDIDGKGWRLASGSDDNTIRLWDPKTGAETARLEGHTSWVTELTVLPGIDGKGWRLASGSADDTIRLWDPKSGAETARLEGHAGTVTALTVLSGLDGKGWRLASGSYDNTIRLWDPKSGAETARLEGHTSWVTALTVLPDIDGKGWRLASGSGDKTIRLWDPKSGAETARLEGHAGPVRALTVLPGIDRKGWRLASGSADDTIRLWDPTSGAELTRLEVDAAVLCVAALPHSDGQACRIVAGDQIGRLHWLEIVT